MSEQRIGAFGGTFDPIHNGHLRVAREVVSRFRLDQLLIIPAHRPPHKNRHAISDAYHRYAMAALAALGEPAVEVSTIELEAPDRPYTVETISRLREQYGDSTRLFFVMGADSFEEITSWREPARLLKETNLIVVTRPGYEIDISGFAERFGSEVIDLQAQGSARLLEAGCCTYVIDCASEDISSTGIRQRVREGRAIEGLVPELVEKYIRKYQLYGGS